MQIGAFGAPPAALESLNQVQAARQLNSTEAARQGGRSDTVSISGFGRQKNVLEGLMKQKEGLKEYRSALITHTLETGGEITQIQAELDEIDEQLQDLDTAMKKFLVEQAQPNLEEKEKAEAKAMQEEAPKTEEEAQAEQLNAMASMAGGMEQAKAADAAVSRLGRETARLEAQVVRDREYGSDTTAKRAEIRELKARAEKAGNARAGQLGSVAHEAEKLRQAQPDEVITEAERLEAERAAKAEEEGS